MTYSNDARPSPPKKLKRSNRWRKAMLRRRCSTKSRWHGWVGRHSCCTYEGKRSYLACTRILLLKHRGGLVKCKGGWIRLSLTFWQLERMLVMLCRERLTCASDRWIPWDLNIEKLCHGFRRSSRNLMSNQSSSLLSCKTRELKSNKCCKTVRPSRKLMPSWRRLPMSLIDLRVFQTQEITNSISI